jgi:hypothetical protein
MATTQLKQRLLALANTFVDIVEDMEKEEQKPTTSVNVRIEYKLPQLPKPTWWNASTEDITVDGINAATEVVMQATMKHFAEAGALSDGKTPPVVLTITDSEDGEVLYRHVKTVVPKTKWNFHDNDLRDYHEKVAEIFGDGGEDAG